MLSGKQIRSFVLLLTAMAALALSGWAQTYTVLYSFTGGADGAFPFAGVIRDSAGNLDGTTSGQQNGTVFKLNSKGKIKVLHTFAPEVNGFNWPFAGLARDSVGNLYGTSVFGGDFNRGTVYKLDKKDNFSLLYSIPSPWDAAGEGPLGPLTLDEAGNIYGAGGGGNGACNGGPNCGVVFKINAAGEETTIHAFAYGKNGFYPNAGLIRDGSGNLYGTTVGGGTKGAGTIFRLDPAGNETVLYTFKRKPDGAQPEAGLLEDASGNFYGTTVAGGKRCSGGTCGVVFKLDAKGKETVLYAFNGMADGGGPNAPLIMDSAGNLYGTTTYYGGQCVCGVVFKLNPSGKETVLYTFTGGLDGGFPNAGLAMDSAGNLYGTAPHGGAQGFGVVFKITP